MNPTVFCAGRDETNKKKIKIQLTTNNCQYRAITTTITTNLYIHTSAYVQTDISYINQTLQLKFYIEK